MEVGVGFVKSEATPCLCFQVTGPYTHPKVMQFIQTIADIVILEQKQGQSCDWLTQEAFWEKGGLQRFAHVEVLQWRETDGKGGLDKKRKLIWGQETDIVKEMGNMLASSRRKLMMSSSKRETRRSLLDACTQHFSDTQKHQHINSKPILDVLMNRKAYSLSDVRQKLVLQKSLEIEGKTFLASLRLKDDPIKKRQQERIGKKEKINRRMLAKEVADLPIVRLFHQILSQVNAASRTLGILTLETSISEGMQQVYAELASAVDRNHAEYVRDSIMGENAQSSSRDAFLQVKQQYVDKSIGIENLWRELCHIYEADPCNQHRLAYLAAQHLLDGFALEVFDGDAGIYCKFWVETVLTELQTELSRRNATKPKIFVLSVMGLQSSGKSTMLNLMFGTRLPTSAGRCTRGIFMQLIPSERAEYDYVMLLDTEGLRSNEFHGLKDSVVRDNRLATFGLLPADACILMVSNEDDGALKDVLPMVLLAFKSSNIAEKCGGRIKTKMFFVYRSVDTNDRSKLKRNKQKLHESLMEAAKEVSKSAGESSATARDIEELIFSDLRVEEDEYWGSDVRFMGNLKRSYVPPHDTPEWSYGKDVLKLREYIHARVMKMPGWRATSPKALGEHLSLVWDCICSADFELNFSCRLEYNHYRELQKELQEPKTAVARKYGEVFDKLVEKIRSSRDTVLVEDMEAEVSQVVEEQTQKVMKMAEKARWAQWKAYTEEEWKRSCRNTKEWYKKRVEDLENGVLKYERVIAEYENQCKLEITSKIDSGEWKFVGSTPEDDRELEERFEDYFQKILARAQVAYPPIADSIHQRVMERYDAHGLLTKKFDLYIDSEYNPTVMRNASAGDQSDSNPPVMSNASVGDQSDSNPNPLGRWTQVVSRTTDTIFSYFFRYSEHKSKPSRKEEQTLSKLLAIIDDRLRYCKQFSEVVVDGVIRETSEEVRKAFSREKQTMAHKAVIKDLVSKMTDIQHQWDKDHNVAEKLRLSAKPRLLTFFKGKARGLGATILLIEDLKSLLGDGLKEAYIRQVVKSVTNELTGKTWAQNSIHMRNILDFHLLHLMEEKCDNNDLQVIWCAEDESRHKRHVTDALIQQLVDTKLTTKDWDRFIAKVQYCIRNARKESTADTGGDPLSSFVSALCLLLQTNVDSQLAAEVRERTSNPAHYNSSSNAHISLEVEFYDKKLDGLCQSLKMTSMPAMASSELVEKVQHQLKDQANDLCRPNCTHSCPRCGSSCYNYLNHEGVLHDCIHQPSGLKGSKDRDTRELWEMTCLESLEKKSVMIFSDGDGKESRRVPYSDFAKEFPAWKEPSSTQPTSIYVRESIFFNYQKQLAEYYRRHNVKPCPPHKMPANYNHDLRQLREQLTVKLAKSGDFTSIDDLTHALLGHLPISTSYRSR
ncbi:hypothetical protein KP509_03G099800 [Ceratopteris richardii]|nr:hypothetical protein KP509_03G099800 [Ceratopteris richardii]